MSLEEKKRKDIDRRLREIEEALIGISNTEILSEGPTQLVAADLFLKEEKARLKTVRKSLSKEGLTKEEIESLGWIQGARDRWFIPFEESGDEVSNNYTLWAMGNNVFSIDKVFMLPFFCFYDENKEPITDVESLKKEMRRLNIGVMGKERVTRERLEARGWKYIGDDQYGESIYSFKNEQIVHLVDGIETEYRLSVPRNNNTFVRLKSFSSGGFAGIHNNVDWAIDHLTCKSMDDMDKIEYIFGIRTKKEEE